MSPSETAVAVAVATVVTIGGIVWGGAALAATITGHRFAGGPTVAIKSIPGIIRDWRDPATGWTTGTWPSGSPGPIAYWTATIGLTAAVVAIVAGGWIVIGPRLSTGRKRMGADLQARFATSAELRGLRVRGPVRGRFVLGRGPGGLLATENPRHTDPPDKNRPRLARRARVRGRAPSSVAIFAPSQSGKTSEFAIPGVLDWIGPTILLSVKRDLLDSTLDHRRTQGEVRVFDPGGILAVSQGPTIRPNEIARWSPLRGVVDAATVARAGAAMASFTPTSPNEDRNFWRESGAELFTGLLGTTWLDRRGPSMARLARWILTQQIPTEDNPTDIAEIIAAGLADPDPIRAEVAERSQTELTGVWSKHDELLSSVYGTAQTVVRPWLDEPVRAATDLPTPDPDGDDGSVPRPGWVDLDWLMSGDNTLYLLSDMEDYERLAPVLCGLLSDMKSQVYQWDIRGRRLPTPLLMLIDEAANMPLDWLPKVAATCAGIGLQLVTVWQSIGQIDVAYGRNAQAVLTNHSTKIFLPGSSDDATLAYISKLAGTEITERRSSSTDTPTGAGNTAGRRSAGVTEQDEPFLPYHLPRVAKHGQALLFHRNLPPAIIHGRPWWLERRQARPPGINPAVRTVRGSA